MIRGKIWFRCAIMHDPVTPIVAQPGLIGWEAKHRQIDLLIERAFKGDELVARMKGWITVSPSRVIEIVKQFGRLTVLDDRELVVETDSLDNFNKLKGSLKDVFGAEVDLDLIEKKKTD
jgi:hypothetical protein